MLPTEEARFISLLFFCPNLKVTTNAISAEITKRGPLSINPKIKQKSRPNCLRALKKSLNYTYYHQKKVIKF
jgi:hypothetical protein